MHTSSVVVSLHSIRGVVLNNKKQNGTFLVIKERYPITTGQTCPFGFQHQLDCYAMHIGSIQPSS